MKKVAILFVIAFCVHGAALAQHELKFFKSDNTFYLGSYRLLESEMRQVLHSNPSALESWERGNAIKGVNTGMKVATGVLITVGGVVTIVSFTVAMTEAAATLALFPLLLVSNTTPSYSFSGLWLAAGLVLMGAGTVTGIMIPVTKARYQSCYSDVASIYNRDLYKTSVSLHIGTTGNGFGFSLKF